MIVTRVLDPEPVASLDDYVSAGGGSALDVSLRWTRDETIEELDASGLRGRGGAGFPTGKKWRTVTEHESGEVPTTVVVNAAEGEPGSFKDRALIRANPYRVLEGALVAAHAFGATDLVVALKASFTEEIKRLRAAVEEIEAAGWCGEVAVEVFEGPQAYLYGEETGLLEALDGRQPFPRIAPPWRQGVVEVEITSESSGEPSGIAMATETRESPVPPALVNNVETFAHVAQIMAHGADWFRETGTEDTPGTVVCTVTGSTKRHGVAEFEAGTTLEKVIDTLGGGPIEGRTFTAVLSGVSNPLLLAEHFDTPLTHADMQKVGSGLGATGFIVFDDRDDLVEVVQEASRFLAVESCGQCRPCKGDGLAIADLLQTVQAREAAEPEWSLLDQLRDTVVTGARCYLATQQQQITLDVEVLSAIPRPDDPRPVLIAPIVDIREEQAVLDETQVDKNPDWTHGGSDSGQPPVERLADTGV
ncbi:MAG: NADH-ubiquinone oxidoreductase-F iron-sulfur binding region domain-containing protein [Acidimicrobiales bacterium]|nr:NADH-ubiquinone oxidoreductase-F iron-sulfur binding region domain-containing protein [Acidimicrobiales bacterium]